MGFSYTIKNSQGALLKRFILLFLPVFVFALNIDFDSFSADFTQTVTNEHKKKITYNGALIVKKPDKALWSYKKPVRKDVFVNGQQVIVYEPELSQAVYMNKKTMPSIDEMLKNAVDMGGGKYKANSGGKAVFFSMKDSLPQNITYADEMDNQVEIRFSNQKKNVQAPNSLFEFKATEGIDIIKQ